MTVPDIPPATHEGRMSYPQVPVQSFESVPVPEAECQAAFDKAVAAGGAGFLYPTSPRIEAARELLESPQGYGSGGFDIQEGAAYGWPVDVEPPEGYETPLHPGPHGG